MRDEGVFLVIGLVGVFALMLSGVWLSAQEMKQRPVPTCVMDGGQP